jgi:pSer/pThr/pTyr-binding forkhead associated (FHA) protein
MPKLVVLSEGFTGLSHELKAETTTIGRTEENTFTIAENSVSSRHCEIVQRGNEYYVKDLGSTNGTYINGQKVKSSPLKSGQILRLGSVDMRLESGDGKSSQQNLDQTVIIPKGKEGVHLSDLESGGKSVAMDKNGPFKKKSDKANKVFIGVFVAMAVIIVVLLVFAVQKMQQ